MKNSHRFYFLLSVFGSAHVVLLHHGKSLAPLCHLLFLNFCSVWEAADSLTVTTLLLQDLSLAGAKLFGKTNRPAQMLPGLEIIISKMQLHFYTIKPAGAHETMPIYCMKPPVILCYKQFNQNVC